MACPESTSAATHAAAGTAAPVRDWLVTCTDQFGRRQTIIVFADERGVVLLAPPGETAVLAPLQVARLRAALSDAAGELERIHLGRGDRGG